MATLIQEVHANSWALGAIPLGVALDLAIGHPGRWPHPVRAIGRLIGPVERGLRIALAGVGLGPRGERLAGVVLAVLVVGFVASVAWLAGELCGELGGPATLIGRALLVYWGLSIRDLGVGAIRAAEAPDLASGRRELARLDGRDASLADRIEFDRRCVEAVGGGANDAVVAPLFWLAVAGPAGLWAYKAVDILDRRAGRRSNRRSPMGGTSAVLDDLANLIPSRITWLLIALSAALLGEDGASALRIGWRDGRKHRRPHAAWGEAAIAGALGVQLGGRSTLGGVAAVRPLLGDPVGMIDRSTVRRAVRLMQVAAIHAAALAWTVRVLLD